MFADILKGNFQMYTLQWVGGALADPDILRRVFHSQKVPPTGFNRGHFSDPEADRLIDEATQAIAHGRAPRAVRQSRSSAIAELAPYISLWTKTNYRHRPPGPPRRSTHADGGFQLPQKCLSDSRIASA